MGKHIREKHPPTIKIMIYTIFLYSMTDMLKTPWCSRELIFNQSPSFLARGGYDNVLAYLLVYCLGARLTRVLLNRVLVLHTLLVRRFSNFRGIRLLFTVVYFMKFNLWCRGVASRFFLSLSLSSFKLLGKIIEKCLVRLFWK